MGYAQDNIEELAQRKIQFDKYYMEMEQKAKEERDALFSNEDFINWLVGNIENFGRDIYVSTDDDSYGNKLDLAYRNNIIRFFQGVDFYAAMRDEQQYNDVSSCSNYYVLYEDFGFSVSCQYGETTTWRITRIEPVNPEMFIDFRKILKFYKERNASRNRNNPENK